MVTLFAGDALFDEVGMLQAREFDGESVIDMAHDAARRLADGHHRANTLIGMKCEKITVSAVQSSTACTRSFRQPAKKPAKPG